jgi:hypothetical protein
VRFGVGAAAAATAAAVRFGAGATLSSFNFARLSISLSTMYARNYINTSETSVQNRKTLKDEVAVLNQAIKDGIVEHVDQPSYEPIAGLLV